MPFTMTHLEIAKGICAKTDMVKDRAQFYLGSIAPDAVHVRRNYETDMKKQSHFCFEDHIWGQIDDNIKWRDDIIDQLNLHKNDENFDFYFGYFTHILADTLDNEKLHIPFKTKYNAMGLPVDKRGETFYNDKYQNNFKLYELCTWKEEAWDLLNNTPSIGVPNIITAEELDIFKEDILTQYHKERPVFDSPVRFFTLQDNLDFIENSIDDIVKLLEEYQVFSKR